MSETSRSTKNTEQLLQQVFQRHHGKHSNDTTLREVAGISRRKASLVIDTICIVLDGARQAEGRRGSNKVGAPRPI